MLLRSSSSPILKTLISVSAEAPSPGSPNHLHLPTSAASLPSRTRSRSCSTALARTVSESNISELLTHCSFPKRRKDRVTIVENDEEAEEEKMIDRVWACHALSLSSPSMAVQTDGGRSDTLLLDEGCVGDGGSGGRISGGRICSGGGSGGSNEFFSDSNKSTDVYYRQMIQANPSNPLVLGNYAKYLKQVRGDLGKAEEYCERAILANQEEDGGALSMYADIIWERSKDAERAAAYFDRAVQAAPEDCYVAASYARFLWDAEEEEEEEEVGKNDETTSKGKDSVAASWTHTSSFFHGQAPSSTPIAAAS